MEKAEPFLDPGGWAKYAPPTRPIQATEQSSEKEMVLGQNLFSDRGVRRNLPIFRRSGPWMCECGTLNHSRVAICVCCERPRSSSSIVLSPSNRQRNRLPGETNNDVEERDMSASKHWKHVRRRAEPAGTGEVSGQSGDKNNTAGDLEAKSSALEREERERASANGGYVQLRGTQKENGDVETGGTASWYRARIKANRSRRNPLLVSSSTQDADTLTDITWSPAIRKTVSGIKTPAAINTPPKVQPSILREVWAPSGPAEVVARRNEASQSTPDGWKAWRPPVRQAGDAAPEQPETEDGPTIRYQDGRRGDMKGDPLRIRRAENNDSPRQMVWNSATLGSVQVGASVSQPSENDKARDRFSEDKARDRFSKDKPARGGPGGALARDVVALGTSQDKSRVGDRNRSRRRQQQANDYDDEGEAALARIERKRQRKKEKSTRSSAGPPTPIILPEYISVGNLAAVLRVRIEDFVSRMKSLGFDGTSNDHVLDTETAGLIAAEFNFEPVTDLGNQIEDLVALPPPADTSYLLQRPPVITIMGHVDHGKTTLLDFLRKSSVAASEHGGITQHIGAFTVPMPSGQIVTFLDTPGHAAFLSMRQRGANVTDIVILVVAADDSVKPQTIEAINHAKAANVPMIVAVNKIDKPDADVTRVKQDLARHGVEVEDLGGDTQVVCVSGKTGQGMEELEDAAVALADVLDLRAETDGQAEGWILEATTKKGGRVATVLVRRGTIVPGSIIVAGTTWTRVRSLRNEAGQAIPSAGPGTPAEVDGWREQPEAGDEVLQAPNEQRAKDVVELRLSRKEKEKLAADVAAVNEARRLEQEKRDREEAAAKATEAGVAEPVVPAAEPPRLIELPFIVRGDVSGSVEAVVDSIAALGNSEVRAAILRSAVGPIAPTDVELAAAAKGHLISFNTPVEGSIRRMAEAAGVAILDQSIIYRLVDDVKAKLESVLPALVTSRVTGEAEVAQLFDIHVKGRATVPVAGCKVRNGVIGRTAKVRVVRGGEVVYDGM
jgi:small GTP-binding protein